MIDRRVLKIRVLNIGSAGGILTIDPLASSMEILFNRESNGTTAD